MSNVDVDAVKEEVVGSLAALETVLRGQGHDDAFIREFIAVNDMAGRLVSGSIEKQKNDAIKNRALKRV